MVGLRSTAASRIRGRTFGRITCRPFGSGKSRLALSGGFVESSILPAPMPLRFHLRVLALAAAAGVPLWTRGADAVTSAPVALEGTALVSNSVMLPATEVHNPNALQRIWQWSDTRIRGVFDYIMPDTQERRTLRWSLQPKAGDFVKHDHVRFPMAVKYGLNRRTEIEFGLDPYVSNPFKDGHGSGAANVGGGLKYRWEPEFDPLVRAASGVEITHPLSSAPFEFNDGMNRYSVFTTFARPSPWVENLEHFVNVSYDLLTPTTAVGRIDDDEPQDDFFKVGTGVLWRKKRMTYGLAVSFAHTVDGVSTSYTSLTPSVAYDVPAKYAFNSPGQWQIGAAVEGKRYGDETGVDFRVRVRWDVDFKKVMKEWREARTRARYAARDD